MKLRDEFLTHQNNDEALLVPTGNAEFSGIVKGNNTFGEIISLLKNDITEAKIITEICKKYDAPEDVVTHDVRKILDTLRNIKALEE